MQAVAAARCTGGAEQVAQREVGEADREVGGVRRGGLAAARLLADGDDGVDVPLVGARRRRPPSSPKRPLMTISRRAARPSPAGRSLLSSWSSPEPSGMPTALMAVSSTVPWTLGRARVPRDLEVGAA